MHDPQHNAPWWRRLPLRRLNAVLWWIDRALAHPACWQHTVAVVQDALEGAGAAGDRGLAAQLPDQPALALEGLFAAPQHRLVVYGSLAPGERHEDYLLPLGGTWEPAQVEGDIDRSGEYPLFYWRMGGAQQAVRLFRCAGLPAHWAKLDDFEGPDYRRVLVPVLTRAGWEVAQVYVAAAGGLPESGGDR